MTKPTILLWVLLGIFCVEVCQTATMRTSIRSIDDDDSEDDSDADDEASADQFGDPAPDLNCVLFGTSACNATCNTIGYLYGVNSNGTCNALQSCICQIEQESDLKSLWGNKIQNDAISNQILSVIEADSDLSAIAVDILLEFPQLNDQLLDELKDEFYDIEDIDNLTVQIDSSPIAQFVPDKYKLNEDKLRQHLSDFIQRSLNDEEFVIADTDYRLRINDFLDKNSGESFIQFDLSEQLRQTNNPSLYKFIKTGPTDGEYKFGFDDQCDQESIPQFVAAAINDEFVKFADTAAKLVPQRGPPIGPSVRTTYSRILPKFSGIADVAAYIDKAPNGSTTVYLRAADTVLDHNVSVGGTLSQTWQFGNNVTIKFDLSPGGAVRQIWKIGKSSSQYERLDDGSVRKSGDITFRDKRYYYYQMETWCRTYEKFFESGNCVVYNKL